MFVISVWVTATEALGLEELAVQSGHSCQGLCRQPCVRAATLCAGGHALCMWPHCVQVTMLRSSLRPGKHGSALFTSRSWCWL